jgi:hypothetical protein
LKIATETQIALAPRFLENFVNLKQLILDGLQVSDLGFLKEMASLQDLQIVSANLKSLDFLQERKSLSKTLVLDYNPFPEAELRQFAKEKGRKDLLDTLLEDGETLLTRHAKANNIPTEAE